MTMNEIDKAKGSNDLTVLAGRDGKGYFVAYGPFLKEAYAIMWLVDENWTPFRIFTKADNKTLKRARKNVRLLRLYTGFQTKFRIETIWVTVPVEEMEKTYYAKHEEIIEDFRLRLDRPRRFAMGVGRNDLTGPVIGDHQPEKIKAILNRVGKKGTEIRVNALELFGNDEGETRTEDSPSEPELQPEGS
jgi:hypothetical protein